MGLVSHSVLPTPSDLGRTKPACTLSGQMAKSHSARCDSRPSLFGAQAQKAPASSDTGARRMRPPEGRTPSECRLAGHGAGVKAFAASAHASSVGTDAVWRPSDRTILTFDLAMVAASTQEWCSFDGAERLERAECKALRTSGSCGSHILHWWTFRRARFDRRNYRRCNSFRPPRWKDSAAVAPWDLVLVARLDFTARAAPRTRAELMADAKP